MHSDDTRSRPGQAIWIRLARASERARDRIERDLADAGLPCLQWYDALLEIERAGPDGLRQNTLQQRLLLPQYGLSRLLQRIAAAGLISRTPCPEDGRGQILTITAKGRRTRSAMWPVYAAAMEAAIGAKLHPREAARLAELLDRLLG
ncbi:MarR family winged helix-turn-helix transcriptional regulator [Defluviimonas salinarum]|uniref:MarR family transcriptional regulator n=1 Tax=Defluviimonas salinarum TaxID=2992147 RepID=A0ABT3IZX8_9RHOB|nr:MarR family transcriptional regulator [Defluviimonas salinarum]MCW3780982.1 MarR family transcriptional regulator [Defluviimonas salinarum]